MNPHDFWQVIDPPDPNATITSDAYPARFDDGRILRLPIRPLPDGKRALASLIINQAGFAVVEACAAGLAAKLAAFRPDVIVGLPTLGLTLAAAVAAKLGHARYIPLGTSEKFWYRAELSVPLSSVTTPDQTKRLFLDPRMLPLLTGRRVVLVDDVISSGASMAAGILLLRTAGVVPVALGTAMLQSNIWRARLADWQPRIVNVLASPILTRQPAGAWAE